MRSLRGAVGDSAPTTTATLSPKRSIRRNGPRVVLAPEPVRQVRTGSTYGIKQKGNGLDVGFVTQGPPTRSTLAPLVPGGGWQGVQVVPRAREGDFL